MPNKKLIPFTGDLSNHISEAVSAGYIRELKINEDWMSYRHPDFPFDSASLQEGRLNSSGEEAFYIASGDYCGKLEVPKHYERVKCDVNIESINVFDLHSFAVDYGYGDAFLKSEEEGGWTIGQTASNLLTKQHGVTGILYQSAACQNSGVTGFCMVVLPDSYQKIAKDFFREL